MESSSDDDAYPLSKVNPEELRKLEEAKKKLNRYKVVDKQAEKQEDSAQREVKSKLANLKKV